MSTSPLCSIPSKLTFPLFPTPKLEADRLALPVSPSPLSATPSPSPKPPEAAVLTVEPSPSEKKCFFVDEAEPLLRCDSTSSGSSALSRTGSFITKGTKISAGAGGEREDQRDTTVCPLRSARVAELPNMVSLK